MSSRRRRTRRGRGALAVAALVAVAAAGAAVAVSNGLVVIDRPRSAAAPAPRLADTSAGALDRPAPAPPTGATAVPAPGAFAPRDSLLPAPPVAVPPADSLAPDSLATGHGPGLARSTRPGAAPVVATAAELAALSARLVVPVAGVRPDQLVDSYDDARGVRSADADGARRHDALDILAPKGTPVVAASAGRVLKLFDSKRGGLTVYTTDESERFVLLYAHLDRYAPALREGARVKQGETIGYVGVTGNANPATPHLHFAVARTDDPRKWYEGTPVNPYPLLRGR